MQIYPAIDLRAGRCVRLYQGKFTQETCYADDPLSMAKKFKQEGAQWLHVVDLDGAKDPEKNQYELISTLANKVNLKIQTGGGIRQEEQIKKLFDAGLTRVVIGSKAVQDPTTVKSWFRKFGTERLILALDVQQQNSEAYIAVHGWQEVSEKKLTDLLEYYQTVNLQHVLITDIARDGTLQGPNLFLYKNILENYPTLELQASGGIGSLADVQALQELALPGAILGRALYENKFNLKEVFKMVDYAEDG